MAVAGEVRPSQLMFTFGIGATLDLPEVSALVMGLDYWNRDLCRPIIEHRLLAAVQRIVGSQVQELRLPPVQEEENDSRGVPAVPFPRWMRCSVCGAMAPLERGIFEKREPLYKPVHFVHAHCTRMKNPQTPPRAIPVRFLLACPDGHLSDVPWNEFIHDGLPCPHPELHMNEFGITGDVSDIIVSCKACGKKKAALGTGSRTARQGTSFPLQRSASPSAPVRSFPVHRTATTYQPGCFQPLVPPNDQRAFHP